MTCVRKFCPSSNSELGLLHDVASEMLSLYVTFEDIDVSS
jgi:hypothetical protein